MAQRPAPSLRTLFSVVVQSLKGESTDFTSGSIPKAVILLAIPMILELCLESVFALVDLFFVGKLGENAVATVGLTESVMTLIYSLAIGISTAATAVVARRTGEKNKEEATIAGAQTLILTLLITLPLSVGGMLFSADILRLMGASESVIGEGKSFMQIMFGGCLSVVFLFVINGIFRGAGNAAIAMKSLWLASFLNIILCPILIHFYGLKGAAMATVAGRTSGVVYQVFQLMKGQSLFKLKKEHFGFRNDLIKKLVSIAWPASFQFIVASGSWIILSALVAQHGGTTASAGYQIAMRNVIFFILPAWGLSNAAATLVGQNLGAGQFDRAEQSVRLCALYNALFMGFVTALFVVFAEPIVSFFTQDANVQSYATDALRIIGSGFLFYGIGMVMTQALNGAGDTKTPTLINLICFWLIQVPLAWYLCTMTSWQVRGVFSAIPIAESLIAVLSFYYFKKGKWKAQKV